MNGFIILDKPDGMTSFKAASVVKAITGEKKIGHTGTLDPMATGVLPLALGKAARFIDYLPDSGKAYIARLKFGVITDTLDITGKVLQECEVNISRSQLLSVLPEFCGAIMQVPPMYSAISVNGVRLYKLARQGVEIERTARRINIDSIELTDTYNDEFEIAVSCSKGTYIRSLIADIGEKLGCGAVMTSLRRTRSNGFCIENAYTPDMLRDIGTDAIIGIDGAFSCYPEIYVSDAQANRFRNGGDLFTERLRGEHGEGSYRVYAPDGLFLGLGRISGDMQILEALKVMGNEV